MVQPASGRVRPRPKLRFAENTTHRAAADTEPIGVELDDLCLRSLAHVGNKQDPPPPAGSDLNELVQELYSDQVRSAASSRVGLRLVGCRLDRSAKSAGAARSQQHDNGSGIIRPITRQTGEGGLNGSKDQ